jgi:beta-N-acetylhexosaminidase
MSSKKDFGRKVIVGIHKPHINEEMKKLLVDFQPNIILFGGAIVSKTQVTNLIKEINSLYDDGNSPLITCDVEGGKINRLAGKDGFKGVASISAHEMGEMVRACKKNGVIGAIDKAFNKIQEEAANTAKNLKDVGIHSGLDLVFDLNLGNPVISDLARSASRDPVEAVDIMMVRAHENEHYGRASCGKHLWGHGGSDVDSHKGTSIMKDEYFEKEVETFELAFQNDFLPMVMSSHLTCPQIDPELPCSLSKKCLSKARQMGFDGIIISDDIFMRALSDHYTIEEMYKLFFNAGGDMMIVGKPDYAQDFFKKSLYEMLESGAQMLKDGEFHWREKEYSEDRLQKFYANYVA